MKLLQTVNLIGLIIGFVVAIIKIFAEDGNEIKTVYLEANDVKVASDTEIAFRQNELEVKKAELKAISDKQRAKAEAAKDIQAEEERNGLRSNRCGCCAVNAPTKGKYK